MGTDDTATRPDLSALLSVLKVEDANGLYQLGNYSITESIGYLIKRVMSVVSTTLDQELARYDITHQQFSILMILTETQCSTGAMTRMLDRLEAKGIVRRTRSSADRRVVNIELTAAGREFAGKMPIVAINVMNRYLQGFEAAELELMKVFMRRILSNAGVPVIPSPTDAATTE
jgi:DNA-binding MarR family transcriptional regulator